MKQQLQYVLIPHPDDEFSAWSLIQNSTENYPVFILLTHGEATGMCDGHGLQVDLGERVPQPQPFTGTHTANCGAQRLDSWHAFLDGMAEIDSRLDSPALVGTVEGFELRVGEQSARAVFDGGDGRLSPLFVTDALQTVRRHRDRFPVQREYGVIGAAYYNDRYPGAWRYTHPDHLAVHRALFDTDQGLPGPQWGLTAHSDPDAAPPHGRIGQTSPDVFAAAMSVAPDGQRTGIFQRAYGWLGFWPGDGRWPAHETDAEPGVSRSQTFWERFGAHGRVAPPAPGGGASSPTTTTPAPTASTATTMTLGWPGRSGC